MLNDVARWTGRPKRTRKPVEIRLWMEAHGRVPAFGERGVPVVDFGGGQAREEEWVRWFARFEAQDLTFVYRPGEESRFCRLRYAAPDELPRAGVLVVELAR